MRPFITTIFAGLAVANTLSGTVGKRQGTACTSLTAPDVENATVTSFSATENDGICEVYTYLNHPGSSDNVSIVTFLPVDNWNGRFQGIGGGGFSTGGSASQLSSPAQAGWAAGNVSIY